ncbi:MAG: MBOAT family protein [Haliscomenobacteraceae bacterium CHB4]|nr:Peptidoglycan O-acetyltransferase [Saprospiraceae bacterium]MCE7926254.1 MBOAT family protein [Haliscomenobacteraceae bacterium CHB4]
MLFNSLDFAIFLPIVFGLFWTVGRYSAKVQNWILLIASYIFYGFWDWRFLSLLAFSSAFDYFVGAALYKQQDNRKRKMLFWSSVAVNLTLLGFFKYYNFFAESFVNAFSFFGQQVSLGSLQVLLPVGISFYTFQSMSYAFDIYRRELEPVKDIVPFMTFVAFFPHMVAGPIQRASFFLPQFLTQKKFSYELAAKGLKIMLFGFFMKVVVADRLALYVDAVYGNVDMHTGWSYMVATLFFAFQIYGDFAGYSLIAIGCALLFGFYMSPNFNRPYFSGSFRVFWSRWHISLSTWFKDYLYIPLGGNKGTKARTYANLFATFLISGLWHGANWTFVVWGALHGAYQIIERTVNNTVKIKLPKAVSIVLVFALTCIAWVFFRAATVQDAFQIVGTMFTNLGESVHIGDIGIFAFSVTGILMLLLIEISMEYYPNVTLLNHRQAPVRYATMVVMLAWIITLGVFDGSQFIYFQF